MTRYTVKAYDICGEFDFSDTDDFAALLVAAADFARRYPDKVVRAHSPDRCDLDFDGLTEDEREAVQDAIDEARMPMEVLP